jgi:putative ABC transport system permease protein
LCNALFIIEQQTALSRAPSGVADESSVFIISNQWVGEAADMAAREQTDLASLRALPPVADATLSPTQPLGGRGMGEDITIHPDRPGSGAFVAEFPVDDHALNTLGLRLIAGRNFRPEDILIQRGLSDHYASLGGVIVTRGLALTLDPSGNVLGRVALIRPGNATATIIGVVDRFGASQFAGNSSIGRNSILEPLLWADSNFFYFVRARPGQLAAAMLAARNVLYKNSRQRTIVRMQSLADARRDFYRGARGEALLMGVISAILLGVTAFGILGLTSYWVSQRRRQIGTRRALGATTGNILRYFQTENLLIVGTGSLVGILLGAGANLWMVRNTALERLPPSYLVLGTIVVLVLGQISVLWPALRASAVPPAIAARGA